MSILESIIFVILIICLITASFFWWYSNRVLTNILNFYDKEYPLSKIPSGIISAYIPKSTYNMSSSSWNRIINTCKDEYERSRIISQINLWQLEYSGTDYRNYELETSTSKYKVIYGVPELIEHKLTSHLTQTQCYEIVNLLEDNEPFKTLWAIHYNEIKGINEYELTDGKAKVIVSNGSYIVDKVEK